MGIFDTVTFQSQPHFLHKRLVPKSLGPLKNSSKRLGSTHANSSLCLILVLFFILILCQKMYYTNHCILISKSKTDFLNLGIPLLESASTDFVLLEVSSLFRIESQTLYQHSWTEKSYLLREASIDFLPAKLMRIREGFLGTNSAQHKWKTQIMLFQTFMAWNDCNVKVSSFTSSGPILVQYKLLSSTNLPYTKRHEKRKTP